MAFADPAILVPARVRPELGIIGLESQESDIGLRPGPAGDASLFGGPFPP